MVTNRIKYMRCKMQDGGGRPKKPTTVLLRMKQLAEMGSNMHHNHR